MAKVHNPNTKPVAPVIYAVDAQHEKGLVYGTVRRDVVGTYITYVIKNRMDVEMIVDADSIDNLIAALQKVRAEGQL